MSAKKQIWLWLDLVTSDAISMDVWSILENVNINYITFALSQFDDFFDYENNNYCFVG
jgi:hypothetical protein